MKKYLLPALFISAAALLTYGARQIYLLYAAKIKIIWVKISGISMTEISMVLFASVENKGDISAKIKNQHYEVFFNNVLVSTINSKKEIHINSNGKTLLPIAISFNPTGIMTTAIAGLADLLLDRTKVTFEIKGYLSLVTGPIVMNNFVIDMKYTLQELIDLSKEQKPVE